MDGVDLAAIIASNFCCKACRTHIYRKQTNTIFFVGLEDDVEVCNTIFSYAVTCIRTGSRKISEDNVGNHFKALYDSYGFGYARGIQQAFDDQKETDETGWGLVMCIPNEVKNAVKNFGDEKFNAKIKNLSKEKFVEGYEEGLKFSPQTKLANK